MENTFEISTFINFHKMQREFGDFRSIWFHKDGTVCVTIINEGMLVTKFTIRHIIANVSKKRILKIEIITKHYLLTEFKNFHINKN